jgi:hypothetical protein
MYANGDDVARRIVAGVARRRTLPVTMRTRTMIPWQVRALRSQSSILRAARVRNLGRQLRTLDVD